MAGLAGFHHYVAAQELWRNQHTSFGVEGARPTGNKVVLASPSLPSKSRLSKTSSLPAVRSSLVARHVDYLLDRFS